MSHFLDSEEVVIDVTGNSAGIEAGAQRSPNSGKTTNEVKPISPKSAGQQSGRQSLPGNPTTASKPVTPKPQQPPVQPPVADTGQLGGSIPAYRFIRKFTGMIHNSLLTFYAGEITYDPNIYLPILRGGGDYLVALNEAHKWYKCRACGEHQPVG